jgi:surface protein
MFGNNAAFNQDIGGWDTANVTDMEMMFRHSSVNTGTAFNQDISGWNTDKVTKMDAMFQNAVNFDQDLSGWEPGCATGSRIQSKPSNFDAGSGFATNTSKFPTWGTGACTPN